MRVSIVALAAMLSFSHSGQADDIFRDWNSTPSNYVDQSTCQKLIPKYSSKYNDNYFEGIFTAQKGIPSTEQVYNMLQTPEGRYLSSNEQIKVLKLGLCQKKIDDIVFSLLEGKIQEEEDRYAEVPRTSYRPSMELESYLSKKMAIREISEKSNHRSKNNPFPLAKFPVKAFDSKEITVLERLYALYSPLQIQQMAESMNLVLNVMDAVKVQTTIVFRETSERENYVVEHTPSDIYRLALRFFNMEKKKLMNEYRTEGLPFTNLDMIAAAYEMGVISESEISILTSDESFYKKQKSFLRKIGSYFGGVGMTAAQINPATAPYALVGLILYNSYQEINNSKDTIEYENFYFN